MTKVVLENGTATRVSARAWKLLSRKHEKNAVHLELTMNHFWVTLDRSLCEIFWYEFEINSNANAIG